MKVSPLEFKKKLNKLNNIIDINFESQECNALLRRCKKCKYKFKKDEQICPLCNTPRERCKKKSLIGNAKCEKHGGAGGRKIEVDHNGIPIGYNDINRIKEKYVIQTFEDYIEKVGVKCLMILEEFEKLINENKNEAGSYNIDDLGEFFEKNNSLFKNLINYGKMRSGQRIVEIENDKMNKMVEFMRDILTKRCFAIAINNFMQVLKNNISNVELTNKIFLELIDPLKQAYDKQQLIFNNTENIAKEIFPEIIPEKKNDA